MVQIISLGRIPGVDLLCQRIWLHLRPLIRKVREKAGDQEQGAAWRGEPLRLIAGQDPSSSAVWGTAWGWGRREPAGWRPREVCMCAEGTAVWLALQHAQSVHHTAVVCWLPTHSQQMQSWDSCYCKVTEFGFFKTWNMTDLQCSFLLCSRNSLENCSCWAPRGPAWLCGEGRALLWEAEKSNYSSTAQSSFEINSLVLCFFFSTGKNSKSAGWGVLSLVLFPLLGGKREAGSLLRSSHMPELGCLSPSMPSAVCLSQGRRACVGSLVVSLFGARWIISKGSPKDQKARLQQCPATAKSPTCSSSP